MKVLNLHAGRGGNRKLWEGVEVTAVEIDPELVRMYKEDFPEDEVIEGDADEYLLKNYKRFDFIWGSPPCPKNSRPRFWSAKGNDAVSDEYPDLTLYMYKIFLDHWYSGKYSLENVDPYYKPLIPPTKKIGRHLFWTNFPIGHFNHIQTDCSGNTVAQMEKIHGISIHGYKGKQRKDKIIRNCVHPETGLYILDCAREIIRKQNVEQLDIFD
ncbi:DNA cytosine methyltransferase [Flagellimonas flava]|uniref:DNA cytosine methyltransferase n=1 Tax=Flagellimonas flava TaxID=570519 RepID=UPI003D65DEC4